MRLFVVSDWRKSQAIGYATTSFAAAVLNNVFLLYYVDLYLRVYKIDDSWFYAGITIYGVWNAVNDALFGWWMSRGTNRIFDSLRAVRIGGAIWALSFFVMWFPFLGTSQLAIAAHFFVCMCAYDGMLTYVLLAHNSLLADITHDQQQRAHISSAGAVAMFAGTCVALYSWRFWNIASDLYSFRLFVTFVAVLAWAGFEYTVRTLAVPHVKQFGSGDANTPSENVSFAVFTKQLLQHRNFLWFITVNFLQQFNCTLTTSFFAIFLQNLVAQWIPHWANAFSLVIAFTVPHILTVGLSQLVDRGITGTYQIIMGLLIVKVLLATMTFVGGTALPFLVVLFLVVNRISTEGICRMSNLVVADLIDEDRVLNNRSQSMSAAIFGLNALVTKPFQSIAPLVGWFVLSRAGFRDVLGGAAILASSSVDSQLSRLTLGKVLAENPVVSSAMFQLLVLVPVITTSFQIVAWNQFSLHGARLKRLKHSLSHDAVDV